MDGWDIVIDWWGIVDKCGEKRAKPVENPPHSHMFLGEYTYSIDEKKRLAIPTKFRTILGKKAVVTRGLDQCLFLYSFAEWKIVAEKLSKLPLTQADARGFARLMLAGAMEADLDKLGRILVPDYLKEYASLGKKIVIAGVYNRIEIWDGAKWDVYKKRIEKEIGDMAERLKELGI